MWMCALAEVIASLLVASSFVVIFNILFYFILFYFILFYLLERAREQESERAGVEEREREQTSGKQGA